MKLKKILSEIERKDMPQIRGVDILKALDTLNNSGIVYKKGKIKANLLKNTQEDAISQKVDAISSELKLGKVLSPIFISSDGFVLDGHHRVLATLKIFGKDATIDAIQIMLPKIEALKMFNVVEKEIS
jgi:hypothetical protein